MFIFYNYCKCLIIACLSQCHTIGMKLTEIELVAGLSKLHVDAEIMRFELGIERSEEYVSYDGRIMRCLNSAFNRFIYQSRTIFVVDLEYLFLALPAFCSF